MRHVVLTHPDETILQLLSRRNPLPDFPPRRHACQLAHYQGKPYIDPFGRIFLGDFWEWGCSDVLNEPLRDRFATFVVARLLGVLGTSLGKENILTLLDGKRLAVFSTRKGMPFQWRLRESVAGAVALLFAEEDPLDVAGWRFYVFRVPLSGRTTPEMLENTGTCPVEATKLAETVRLLLRG